MIVYSGGMEFTVQGRHLDSVAEPRMSFNVTCENGQEVLVFSVSNSLP